MIVDLHQFVRPAPPRAPKLAHWLMTTGLLFLVGCAAELPPPPPTEPSSINPLTWVEPQTGMELVLIEPGRFTMGSPEDEPMRESQEVQHEVELTTPFYLGRYEVTQGEWQAVMGDNPSRYNECGADCPVETINYHDVQAFIAALAELSGERFRLPTEAEWEYACRAGNPSTFGVGDSISSSQANFDGRSPYPGADAGPFHSATTPAGSYPPNDWGLFDMNGNVWEWVEDEHCPYPDGPVTDPLATCGAELLVIRGGSWYYGPDSARCALRYTHRPVDDGPSLGFRLVREIAPGPESERDTPGPRWGHALIWDAVREEVLLFGGARSGGEYLADTWTWGAGGWRRHEVPGPPARGFPAVAFHEARGTVILHGGRAEGRRPHRDTWEWNGSAWRLLENEGAYQADHHGMVYLPKTSELLAFGGWDGSGVSGETWLFDGVWRRLELEGPPPRSAFGLAYDLDRDVAVLSGGLWIEGQYADVWEWSGDAWRAASGPYDNSSLDHHSLIWDPERRQLIGFGGKNYRYRAQQSTLTIRAGRLETLATEGPEPRHSTPLAWDGNRGQLLLYGGKKYLDGEQVPLGDLWLWDGSAWSRP
jgi:formylglycine-generating enzyme required for sulfatase activity